MKQVKRWWVAVLLGLLLVVTLGGMVLARSKAVNKATAGKRLMVSPASFICVDFDDVCDHENNVGWTIEPQGQRWQAPVIFPKSSKVKVSKITLYATHEGGYQTCVDLWRTTPSTATGVKMGRVCTSDHPGTVGQFSTTTIKPKAINPRRHAVYLRIDDNSNDARIYGINIVYR